MKNIKSTLNKRLMRLIAGVLFIAATLLAASPAQAIAPHYAVIKGNVTYGPTCILSQPGVNCSQPLAFALFDITNYVPAGSLQPVRLLASFSTDKNGAYSVRVPVNGQETVHFNLRDSGSIVVQPKDFNRVEVTEGQRLKLDLYYDTGIRE